MRELKDSKAGFYTMNIIIVSNLKENRNIFDNQH